MQLTNHCYHIYRLSVYYHIISSARRISINLQLLTEEIIWDEPILIHVYIYAYICVCVCVCIHTRTHTHIYIHIYVYMRVCTHTDTYIINLDISNFLKCEFDILQCEIFCNTKKFFYNTESVF